MRSRIFAVDAECLVNNSSTRRSRLSRSSSVILDDVVVAVVAVVVVVVSSPSPYSSNNVASVEAQMQRIARRKYLTISEREEELIVSLFIIFILTLKKTKLYTRQPESRAGWLEL